MHQSHAHLHTDHTQGKSIFQKDIKILNIYEPNTGANNFIKEILLDIKPQINPNTVTVGDFNIQLPRVN